MRFTIAAAVSGLAALGASATPIKRQAASNITDTDILNYALTLEYLEDTFYSDALAQFDTAAFVAAGYPSWVRGRFEQISSHEASHVALLAGALGDAATVRCNYSFPYTDVTGFVGLSQVIENVGVSAYLGAAPLISEKAYLAVAAAITTTEARHQTWVASAANKQNPWSGPYDTALDLDQVYSIAGAFITGCPAGAATLPVKAFPALTITGSGTTATLTFPTTGQSEYLIIYSGLAMVAFPISSSETVDLSNVPMGISYALVSTESDVTKVSDANTVAGPAIMNMPFNSATANPQYTGM